MDSNKFKEYLALLKIRRAAKRRDTIIAGTIFYVLFLSMVALAMLDRLTGRSLVFAAALVVSLGFGFLASWIKLEVIKGSIEMTDALL